MESGQEEEPELSTTYKEISRKEMEEELLKTFHDSCNKLEGLWEDIGFSPKSRYKRSHLVLYHLKVLMNQLVDEEAGLLKKLLDNLDRYSSDIMTLSEELSVKPFEPEEHASLVAIEEVLRLKVDELTKEKFKRVKSLLVLKEQEKQFCISLDMPPYSLSSTDVPSLEQLTELRQHVEMLKDEKDRRLKKYQASKSRILKSLENLGHVPQTALEKEVAYAPDDDVQLSDKNLANLNLLADQLEQCCKTNEQHAEDLRRKLSILWQCLKVDLAVRESCLIAHSDYKSATIESLQQEVQQYEQLKRENMKSFVSNCREQLKELWEKCHVSEKQVNQFTAYFDDNYTEELLNQHEVEINKWQDYWSRFQELFLGIENLRNLWQIVKVFKKKENDRNRFANRGGHLLQEEKERNRLMRRLPKVEEQLTKLADDWESQEGQVFLIQGKRLPDYVAHLRDEYNKEKENEKNLRKKQEEENKTYVSFAPKRAPTPGTPLVQASMAKRGKFTPSGVVFRTPGPPQRRSPRLTKKTPQKSTPRVPFQSLFNDNTQAPVNDAVECSSIAPSFVSISSYTDFKKGLDQDAILNSTAIPPKT